MGAELRIKRREEDIRKQKFFWEGKKIKERKGLQRKTGEERGRRGGRRRRRGEKGKEREREGRHEGKREEERKGEKW
jgi:hypothetical protein